MKKVLLHNTPNDKVRENASFLSLVREKSGKSQEISIKVVCMNPDQLQQPTRDLQPTVMP